MYDEIEAELITYVYLYLVTCVYLSNCYAYVNCYACTVAQFQ